MAAWLLGAAVIAGAWMWMTPGVGPRELLAGFAAPVAAGRTEPGVEERLGLALAEFSDRAVIAAGAGTGEPWERGRSALAAGRSALARGREAEAVPRLVEAVHLAPDSAQAHYTLALAYVRSDNRAAAREELLVLRTLDPNLASLLGNLVR